MSENTIEMNDLLFAALDHAVASIRNGGPLVPFTMITKKEGDTKLDRFAMEMLEQGLEAAQSYVDSLKDEIRMYAIAWDGYITIEDKKWDSIFVEAGEATSEHGVLMIQRYEKKGMLFKKNIPYGNPAQIGMPISKLFS